MASASRWRCVRAPRRHRARARARHAPAGRAVRAQPNVQLSIVPFETNVKNVWPPAATGNRFARPDGTLDTYIAACRASWARAPTTRAPQLRVQPHRQRHHGAVADQPRGAAAHPLRGGVPHGRNAVPALLGQRQPQPCTPTRQPGADLGGLLERGGLLQPAWIRSARTASTASSPARTATRTTSSSATSTG